EVHIYAEDYDVQGKLNALIDGSGYLTGFEYDGTGNEEGTPAGEINEMLADIDTLVAHFVNEFNAVHSSGHTLATDDAGNVIEGGNFFTGTTADTIAVHEDINDDTDLIAASNTGASGDRGNATDLANVYTKRAE